MDISLIWTAFVVGSVIFVELNHMNNPINAIILNNKTTIKYGEMHLKLQLQLRILEHKYFNIVSGITW